MRRRVSHRACRPESSLPVRIPGRAGPEEARAHSTAGRRHGAAILILTLTVTLACADRVACTGGLPRMLVVPEHHAVRAHAALTVAAPTAANELPQGWARICWL